MKSSMLPIFLSVVLIAFGIWAMKIPAYQAGREPMILGAVFTLIGIAIITNRIRSFFLNDDNRASDWSPAETLEEGLEKIKN